MCSAGDIFNEFNLPILDFLGIPGTQYSTMDIERTEVILTSKLPMRSVPWNGKLMAVLNGNALYVPVAFWRKGQKSPLHKHILAAAGLERIRRNSSENMGGCLVKMFMGTLVLNHQSGDFGPLTEQRVILPHIESALREFFQREKVTVHEIDTSGLDA